MKLRLYCADCVQGIPLKVDRGSVDVADREPKAIASRPSMD
jgi:hypothetical protein